MSQRRKLSKSACEKYMACPASYDYYYNQRIVPVRTGSALMFGSAMDAALNALLLNSGNALTAYKAETAKYELGKSVPGKYDYDGELLTEDMRADLSAKLVPIGYKGDIDHLVATLVPRVSAYQKGYGPDISDNQYKALDLIHRAVFEVKAELMIAAYREKVIPQIEQVHNVQKASGPGYLDATVTWSGLGKRIADNKTAGKRYAEDACEYSAQLAMYAAEENISQVTFIVMVKDMIKNRRKVCETCGHVGKGSHKTCDNIISHPPEGADFPSRHERCGGEWKVTISPEADIQIIHGEITPEAMAVAAELQREVQRAVDAKIFMCNVNQCNSQFGKQCEYKNLKWKGSMENLEYRDGKKK